VPGFRVAKYILLLPVFMLLVALKVAFVELWQIYRHFKISHLPINSAQKHIISLIDVRLIDLSGMPRSFSFYLLIALIATWALY